ncbi:MAG: hypothetical protein GXP61_10260 [Epsilonproteobacteria bacterium]|nr:hypothetical protein [Campylobacterota bacterium]
MKLQSFARALVASELFRNLLPKQDDNKINLLGKAKALVARNLLGALLLTKGTLI